MIQVVLRAAIIYVALLLLVRMAGNRGLSKMTAFDAVLVIVVAEVTGNALTGDDYSVTTAILVVLTLILMDVAMSLLKLRSRRAERAMDGVPVLLVDEGKLQRDAMDRQRVDETDILEAARQSQGIARLDDVRYAVLEKDGAISIIPKR